jgi:mannose-6-phosphate isomerase-like protein (cupin superfamily)
LGNFEQFCQKVTVKNLNVKPHEALSLQYHHHRDEFWRVIEGLGNIVIGKETHLVKKGDEFFMQRETNHQITTAKSLLSILKISFGDFDENDIIRLKDKYNRIKPTNK